MILRKLFLLGLVLMMLMGCHGVVPDPPDPPNLPVYRGFFVGITDYKSYQTVYDLMSPAKNTEKLEDLFNNAKFGDDEIPFDSIVRLVDWNATKDNILNGILDTFAEADDNDVSYFYFMGHGSTLNSTPVILPTNFVISQPSSYLTVHELEATLSQIKGTKVVLLETCHAGNFIGKGLFDFNEAVINIFADQPVDLLNKEPYQVLCSSAGDEYTWDSSCGSYFCRYFIYGCNGLNADANADDKINLYEIYNHIRLIVHKQTAQIYPNWSTFTIYEE